MLSTMHTDNLVGTRKLCAYLRAALHLRLAGWHGRYDGDQHVWFSPHLSTRDDQRLYKAYDKALRAMTGQLHAHNLK